MANISLDWIPNTSLREFIEFQWHHLPEALASGKCVEWMETMQALLIEAQHGCRGMEVKLTIFVPYSD